MSIRDIKISLVFLAVFIGFFILQCRQSKQMTEQSKKLADLHLEIIEKLEALPDSTVIQLCEVEPMGPIKSTDYYYITQYNLEERVSKHFKGKEFVKYNDPDINVYKGDTFQIHKNMVAGAEIVRIQYGIPVIINSPQRSFTKQMLVNPSAPNSDHIDGNGFDWVFLYNHDFYSDKLRLALISKEETELRLALVNGLKITQIIFYNTHIHFGFGDPTRGNIKCGGIWLEVIDKRTALVDYIE